MSTSQALGRRRNYSTPTLPEQEVPVVYNVTKTFSDPADQFSQNIFGALLAMAHGTVRGCRDIVGAGAAARRSLVSQFAALCSVFGFHEVETPVLERARTYSAALGATSEVVSSEMFHIANSDDTVLRPEGTAGVMRALHATGVSKTLPVHGTRVWYAGPMFRHERPQRLRLRQFTQLGVEVVGDGSITADIDVITLASSFLRDTPGGADANLVLNTLGSKRDRVKFNAALYEWLQPRYWALSELSRARFDAGNCMRILDSKLSEDVDAMRGAPRLTEYLNEKEIERFKLVKERLGEEGIKFKVDTTLVRGLDYYTSTAFEFVGDGERAVCAGGRYANLHGLDGVGFAVGLDRIEGSLYMKNGVVCGEMENGIVVLPVGKGAEFCESQVGAVARHITRSLRREGMRAVARLDGGKLGKQFSRAIKSGAAAIIVLGPDEVEAGIVKMKIIDSCNPTGEFEQHDVQLDNIVEFCKSVVSSTGDAIEETRSWSMPG